MIATTLTADKMPPFARSFSAHLRNLVVPALAEAGFVFDGSRTFRRLPAASACAQIINFQLGGRFMAGKFTVNLAVYSPHDAIAPVEPALACEYHCSPRFRQRLGFLVPGRLGALARLPVLRLLVFPRDRWWRANKSSAIEEARDAVFLYGLPWLDSHTPDTPPGRSRGLT